MAKTNGRSGGLVVKLRTKLCSAISVTRRPIGMAVVQLVNFGEYRIRIFYLTWKRKQHGGCVKNSPKTINHPNSTYVLTQNRLETS